MTTPALPITLDDVSYAPLNALDRYVKTLSLDPRLLELLKVRCSQLNGCAYCTDMHSADALKAGVPQRQLLALTVWREAPTLFEPREQAVLRLAEAATLLPGTVPAEVMAEMNKFWTATETGHWLMAAIAINAWNRVGVLTGMQPE